MSDKYETPYPDRTPAPIRVLLQPQEKQVEVARKSAKNVAQLHKALGIRIGTALVVRSGILLTPDVQLKPGDEVMVRTVMSSG